jgi:type II secretion system protein N
MTAVTLIRANVRLAHFDDAQMSPDLSTLLQEKKQLRFQARLADGSITGRVSMTGTAASGPVQAEADLSEIQLDQLDAIKTLDRFGLSGSLKGRINYDGSRAPAGMANALLTVTKLSITLNAPFFGITDFVMDQTNADFSVSGGILRLKSLTFDGPMLEGKISGTIELRNPIEQSRLSLTGNAKPRPELFARLQETIPQGVVNTRTLESRGVSFRVRGSIDSPDVTMR